MYQRLPTTARSPLRLSLPLAVSIIAAPTFAADFNGDGVDDMLFRDRSQGDHRLEIVLNGPIGIRARSSIVINSSTDTSLGMDVRVGDFDGDGRSDILTRNLRTGATVIRLMNGTAVKQTRTITELPTQLRESLQGVADFDGDGSSELLYRNNSSGVWSIYTLNDLVPDPARSGPTDMPTYPGLRLVSTADFSGDGKADILLRNVNTLNWRMNRMDGHQLLQTSIIKGLPGAEQWELQAAADFNKDGRADLLLRNRDTGNWWTGAMNGAQVLDTSGATTLRTERSWQLASIADLNGDGYLDALLQRHDTGELAVSYLMFRTRLAGSGPIPVSTPDLRIAATGDFNGDGVAEALGADGSTNWSVLNLRDVDLPVIAPMALPAPPALSFACEVPSYHEFGKISKPSTASANSAFLTWNAPVTRENGEALCTHELGGYEIYRYTSNNSAIRTTRITNPRRRSWLFDELGTGTTHYFRIVSFDTNGSFSDSSPLLSKRIN